MGEWIYGGTNEVYSTPFVYDKTLKTITAGFEGGATQDDDYKGYDTEIGGIAFVYVNNSFVTAGVYSATLSLEQHGVSNNYRIVDLAAKTWEIKPKVVEISWTSASPYIYDGNEKSVSASITNAEDGDEVTLTLVDSGETLNQRILRHRAVDAGLYTALIEEITNPNYRLPQESDYNFDDLSYDWQIDAADIIGLTMEGKTVVYDASVHHIINGQQGKKRQLFNAIL